MNTAQARTEKGGIPSPADLRAAIARWPREERQLYKLAAEIDLNPQRLSAMLNERIPMPDVIAQRLVEALSRRQPAEARQAVNDAAPHHLGAWTCPSGNSCNVHLVPVRDRYAALTVGWARPLPLSADDERDFADRILPEATARARLVLEELGPIRVVTL